MSQKVLNPRNVQAAGRWKPTGPIPQALRKFGHIPDTSLWRPGDLILVSAIEKSWISKRIVAAQELGGFKSDDARWHHAAMYLGDHNICEATVSGVKYGTIYKYIDTHLIRIRTGEKLSDDQRWRIALQSMTRLRKSYSFMTLVSIWLQAFRGFYTLPQSFGLTTGSSIICSKLYADAYSWITKETLDNVAGAVPTPASLSLSPQLTDVDARWLTIG
jgi:hypothetical protein